MTEAQWDAVIAVNLKSAFNFINAVLPSMPVSVRRFYYQYGFCRRRTWKCRTVELCRIQSRSYRTGEEHSPGSRARVVSVPMHSLRLHRNSHDSSPSRRSSCGMDKQNPPASRRGKPEDIADVATFLASDMSSYVTARSSRVDGGMNM